MPENTEQTSIVHATVRSFVEGLRAGAPMAEATGLIGAAPAHLLGALLADGQGPLYVLAAGQEQARRIHRDLRFFYRRSEEVFLFPQWEVPPYDPLSPHPEVEATRLATLAALLEDRARAVVLPVQALMQRVIPKEVLATLCERLILEEEYERESLGRRLLELGYQPVPLVEDRGTFSLRGDILDIYPPTRTEPVRIDFFGDFIERMRPFDTGTQRSRSEELQELVLIPSREMVVGGEHWQTFSRRLKERGDALGIPRPEREAILDELREGIFAPGREQLLPLNYERLDPFFSYLAPGRWILFQPAEVERQADAMAAEIEMGEHGLRSRGALHVASEDLYLRPQQLFESLMGSPRLDFPELELFRPGEEREQYRFQALGHGDLRQVEGSESSVIERLAEKLDHWKAEGWRVMLVCHQRSQAERLLDLLAPLGTAPAFDAGGGFGDLRAGRPLLVLGDVGPGFRLSDEKLALITEEEIFGRARRRRSDAARAKAALSSLAQLREGDFVVHTDHGIGRYRGLLHMKLGVVEGDFLHLEYAGGDKLYLPVERITKVQKYVGGEGHTPRLDKMGGGAWEKAKLRARAAAEEMARDLLKVQARRELRQGFPYSPPDRMYREFEAAFAYEETPDQLAAIEQVIDDMTSPQPMDRLVCGDVGYGKTEVALRAAFKAVQDGKQVALLVPTTVLARQHWETVRQRFADHPVEVEMVSRLRSAAEQKTVFERLKEGRVDIVVGTHRLLQRDARFKDLGLIIIDEEQRFGVAHKERLKQLRAEVDVLTLTATPIPRTLHMSLMGLRELSVIETPPVDRLAIRTYVTRFDDELIRKAVLRELRRGGQVFFVHNRVQSIAAMADHIRTLVPEAKVAVGHGQMGEKDLERVMMDFVEAKSNVLVCSTIIESGLDIPKANTIIVNRADCFGLSQLYQLRGRVGRSNQRAYAYLLIPGEATLSREARERLRVLQELTELGAGFRIASHDLELRGAGDLLGSSQSGQITAVGFEMYTELLEETVHELKGLEKEQKVDPEVRLGLSAYLPEDYIADPGQRLAMYQKMAAAEADEDLYEAAEELRDRFGELPEPAALLIEVMKLRVLMKRLKVELAEYDGRQMTFAFHAATPVPPEKILELLKEAGRYRFSPDYRLSVQSGKVGPDEILPAAKKELQGLL